MFLTPRTHRTLPEPICKAFLVCRQVKPPFLELIAQNNIFVSRYFPSSCNIGFWTRLTGGHGEYLLEVELRDEEGTAYWKDGLQEIWRPESPRQTLEATMAFTPVFPKPGDYYLVLTANGQEIGREPYYARAPGSDVD